MEERTKLVLKEIEENDLYLKPEKAEFCTQRLEYLGMIIEPGRISMDPAKLDGIRSWPSPTTVKQLRSFLGFGNFYRKFIRKYSTITQPLNNLLKKNTSFNWTQECEDAFLELKKRFTEEPVLMMPDQNRQFIVEADASKYASGAVLQQEDKDGKVHPCAFISKIFSPTEQKYMIYDRELLAILQALWEW